MGGGRPDAGPLPFDLPVSVSRQSRAVLCLSNSGFLRMIAIAGLSPDRDGGKRAGRLTAAAARFAEDPALAIRNLSGLFRINAAIGGCFVSGFGDHRFSTGPAQSLPTRLGHAALAVADDGGSGT
jgi:hypothetical protein